MIDRSIERAAPSLQLRSNARDVHSAPCMWVVKGISLSLPRFRSFCAAKMSGYGGPEA